jgi:hypothetical protein
MTNAEDAPGKPARAKQTKTGKKTRITPAQREAGGGEEGLHKHWRVYFLAALAETSNVTAACAASGASPSRAYKTRREDPRFARAWRDALYEGYENLELETLHRLRSGDTDKRFDVANAIRLLGAHRETIARERARRDNQDERAVLDSIDTMIDQMRERAAANAALLAEDSDGDPHGPG